MFFAPRQEAHLMHVSADAREQALQATALRQKLQDMREREVGGGSEREGGD